MSLWTEHKHRLHWIVLFALACVVEWAAQQVKTWAGNKITAPRTPPTPQPESEPAATTRVGDRADGLIAREIRSIETATTEGNGSLGKGGAND